jgi:ABC-2 type transport system permease protein
MRETLCMYGKLIGIAFRSRMQYRSDFLMGFSGVIILTGVNISLMSIMLSRFQSLQGWALWDIVMLYGMWLIAHCVNSMFFFHISSLEDDILQGKMDQYLIRPFSPLLQFLGREFNYVGIADLSFGIVAVITAYLQLGLHWSPLYWLYFLVAIISGAIIEISLILAISSTSFWLGRARALVNLILQVNWLTPQYPLDIFAYGVRVFITAFIPFAFMNYYPLTILLNKPNALAIWWIPFLSPLIAIMLATVARTIWRNGLRVYTSSGN